MKITLFNKKSLGKHFLYFHEINIKKKLCILGISPYTSFSTSSVGIKLRKKNFLKILLRVR